MIYFTIVVANVPEMCGKLVPGVKVCERTDVSLVNNRLRVCPHVRLHESIVLYKNGIHFPCFDIGKNGISVTSFGLLENQQVESEMYDEIDFEQQGLTSEQKA
jgi:hypothetical protein